VFIRKFLITGILITSFGAADEPVFIQFSELGDIMLKSSPHVKMSKLTVDRTRTERDAAMQWSNPSLNIAYETIKNGNDIEREQVFSFEKYLRMPWVIQKDKNAWKAELHAVESSHQQRLNDLRAEVNAGYAQLRIMQQQLDQFAKLKLIYKRFQDIIDANLEEGSVSPLNAHLLSVGLFGLETERLEIEQEYRKALSNWKQLLGLDEEQTVILSTPIDYKIATGKIPQSDETLKTHVGLKSLSEFKQVADYRLALEKGQRLPDLVIEGGYKQVAPSFRGYVIGLSLPLPLMNRNNARIEQQKISQNRLQHETDLYRQTLNAEIRNLGNTIQTNAELLSLHPGVQHFEDRLEDLLIAYREGSISLPDALSAIDIYKSGARSFGDQLTTYYAAIFRLEAISGKTLIQFTE